MHQEQSKNPLFIKEADVRRLLEWNDCVDAMESALVASTNSTKSDTEPYSASTPRTFTPSPGKGVLLSMPGFVGNYTLSGAPGKHSTLACKLVTSFSGNARLNPPLPSILATILILDSETGQLKAICEATEITAWRTAAVSLAATKHLFVKRQAKSNGHWLAILGAGTQVSYRPKYNFKTSQF